MDNKKNYSVSNRDDMLDFYEYLFDDMLEDFIEAKDPDESEEIKRIRIFREALDSGLSLNEVSERLSKEKLRGLYERNPVELVLKFCFDSNGCENAYRQYDYKGFIKLWKSLGYKRSHSTLMLGTEKIGKQSLITLGKLKEYVLTASKPEFNGVSAKTASVTLNIKSRSDELNLTSPDAENQLKALTSELSETLCEACESARYYFAKYAYYLICHRIIELRELLVEYTDKTPTDALKMICARGHDSYLGSIIAGVYNDTEISEIILGESRGKQLARELLRAALNNLPLKGTSAKRKNISPLFTEPKSGEYLALSATLRDKTYVFDKGADPEKHSACKKAIDALEISNFEGFALDFSALYQSLFGLVLSDGTEDTKGYGKNYLMGILDGKYDMSRSAVMLFLASVKASLFNAESLISDPDSPFDRDSVLTLSRVNEVLDRMGYVNVGDDVSSTENSALDNLYYEIFTADTDNGAVLEALRGRLEEFADTYGYNPLPFEIAAVSAKERGTIILTENKK